MASIIKCRKNYTVYMPKYNHKVCTLKHLVKKHLTPLPAFIIVVIHSLENQTRFTRYMFWLLIHYVGWKVQNIYNIWSSFIILLLILVEMHRNPPMYLEQNPDSQFCGDHIMLCISMILTGVKVIPGLTTKNVPGLTSKTWSNKVLEQW